MLTLHGTHATPHYTVIAPFEGPANTLSKGIWKSVYVTDVPLATVAITHVTPHTRYQGAYPTTRLQDGEHGGFVVNVTTHLQVPCDNTLSFRTLY